MTREYQFLDSQMPIVDPETGRPTDYFLRAIFDQLKNIEGVDEDVEGKVPSTRAVNTGTGLTGGGDLSEDRTISLSAAFGDLTDVDMTTTPPTDQQVAVYDEASGLWLPADQSGGGGGGGGYTFHGAQIHRNSVNIAVAANAAIPWTTAAFDTDSFFSAANSGFVIPAGVTKVRLDACLILTTDPANSGAYFTKNGVQQATAQGDYFFGCTTLSQVIEVAEGDILRVASIAAATIQASPTFTHFSMQVIAGSMVESGGGATSGTSFPGSPATGDRFYRTDRNIEYFYDGTQWLSTTLYPLDFGSFAGTTADFTWYAPVPWKGVYDVWLERYEGTVFRVAAGEWDLVLGYRDAANTVNNITTLDGSAAASGTWVNFSATIAALLDASAVALASLIDEVSGTTNVFGNSRLWYRLVG